MKHVLPVFLTLLLGAGAAEAQWWDSGETPGAPVGVSIEVDGRRVPLYASPDGSTRWYLEAREGSSYAVVLSNRTAERLGVVLTVDGLNAISGERDSNRMYVLGPWEQSTIRGWRTSLADVRRFTFVDERASYAARPRIPRSSSATTPSPLPPIASRSGTSTAAVSWPWASCPVRGRSATACGSATAGTAASLGPRPGNKPVPTPLSCSLALT